MNAHRVAALSAILLGALAPAAHASHAQESIFQDDDHLLYTSTATVDRTLGALHKLGVTRVRVTVKWSALAPAPQSRVRPRGFAAADPAAYPAGAWFPYDRVLLLGARHDIAVEFTLTAPGPLWAMQRTNSTPGADHWAPSATEFASFVRAAGLRYDGRYDHLPAVRVWSIWNEPNQPGWLAPQWRRVAGHQVLDSPRLYRRYVTLGSWALWLTGHPPRTDTILVGELAPEGYETSGAYVATTPMPFLRALYCVDRAYRPLRGAAAAALGCPVRGSRKAFVQANLGLFAAGGFAHHPYYFFHQPAFSSSDPNFVPLANLDRLEHGLDRAMRAYRFRRRLPIYVDEYGYQTNPPDPYSPVSLAQQARYLNQADYIAWRDPRVRSVAQFLLYDAGPDLRYAPGDFHYWDTFQTGLLFASGSPKPALAAYPMPIWLPHPTVRRGGRVAVWGWLRPARGLRHQRAAIVWRAAGGRFRTVAVVGATRYGFLTARVRPPGTGELRIAWRAPSGAVLVSRGASVTVR